MNPIINNPITIEITNNKEDYDDKEKKKNDIIENKKIKRVKREVNPHEKAEIESINITKIHEHLKNNTPCGKKIKEAFIKNFPEKPLFTSSIISGANRSTHHDFKLLWIENNSIENNSIENNSIENNSIEKTVEYKGSKNKTKIDITKSPWIKGVQFYNGTANKFSVGNIYSEKFYNTMIPDIISHFNMLSDKPTYEEWSKDIFKQSKPTTNFQCELREKGYKGKYLDGCRRKFNKEFILNEDQLKQLQEEVFKKANDVLEKKDYWLQIYGKMEEPDDFEVHWTGKIKMLPIKETKQIISKSGCDINFEFICENDIKFKAKLRWGYGQCIANLRLDFK
jgi:hypothetical protein